MSDRLTCKWCSNYLASSTIEYHLFACFLSEMNISNSASQHPPNVASLWSISITAGIKEHEDVDLLMITKFKDQTYTIRRSEAHYPLLCFSEAYAVVRDSVRQQ